MIKDLYYVTGNPGKYEMVKNYLTAYASVTIKNINLDLFEEQTLDLQKIAISKAEQAWSKVGRPVLVDDSGIFFKRYNQFPGVMTKFVFQALGFEGLFRLYDEGDEAEFVTYLGFKVSDSQTKIFEGCVRGTLIKPHNYDKQTDLPYQHILVPYGQDKTLFELTKVLGYSEFNPRIIALQKLIDYLKLDQA